MVCQGRGSLCDNLLTDLEFSILLHRITREKYTIFSISITHTFEVSTHSQTKEMPFENKLFVLANAMHA